MKFQILNNEELGFFDNNGNKKAIMKLSGSNFIIDPVDTGTNIIMGQGETVNDLELGIVSTPINMTFLGGGTISSNAGTLYIGDGVNDDKVVLTGVTIGSSVNFSAGLTGSFQGSFTGDGSNITGITATTAPGGNNKTIQFNDNNTATGGNNNFTFDKTTNIVELTGSINVSGSSSADYFFGDGSGLTNIVGAFPFTGSAGVSGSIIVEGPVTASKFSGDGSGLTNVAGVFPFTGSAEISGSLDVNGNVTATAFYGNGANITGVTSIFTPTGQDKSLQFNKGGTDISGSSGLLFDYNSDSLYVAQAVTASEFTGSFVGDGSNLTGILTTPFPYTGSAIITGSLEVIGDITASNSVQIGPQQVTLYGRSDRTSLAVNRTPYFYAGNNAFQADLFYTYNQGSANQPALYIGTNGGGAGRGIYAAGSGLRFASNNSTPFYFNGATNTGTYGPSIGIGTDPEANLDIKSLRTPYNYFRISGSTSYSPSAEVLIVSKSGDVGIGTWSPNHKLEVIGDISASTYYGDGSSLTGVASFPYTGSAIISGSLIIDGGPTNASLFEVNGSSGQLFSITDSLSGSLFAVSDVSGLPILEVFSDDTIKMGSFNNEALEISGSDVNFNNLPTTDPGVVGRLYQTGSDAIGATAGFQVVCISQG